MRLRERKMGSGVFPEAHEIEKDSRLLNIPRVELEAIAFRDGLKGK
jgi:hypothetical protein